MNIISPLLQNDGLGLSIRDEVNITVINLPPNCTKLADFFIHVNSTGNYLVWNITDASTNNPTYVVYHDSVVYSTGSWISK